MKKEQYQLPKTLKEIQRRKKLLNNKLKIRAKLIEIRLRRFENSLNLPNITRELFRNTQYELFAPIVASFAVKNEKIKNIFKAIGSFIAGLSTSLALFRNQRIKTKKERKFKPTSRYKEDELFI